MLFGKYGGVEVSHVPTHYLRWLSSRDVRNVGLKHAIAAELRLRELNEVSLQLPVADAAILLQLIEAGIRVLGLGPDQRQRLDPVIETLEQALLAWQAETA